MPPNPKRYARKPPLLRLIVSWIIYAGMRTVVLFPLRWQLAFGMTLGRALGILIPQRRRIAERNIEVCFPELSADERRRLVKDHFAAFGACLIERAMGWFGSFEKIRRVVEVEGAEHVKAALEKGRGIVFYSTHFTSAEFFFPVLATLCPRLCLMYKTQKNAVMNEKIHAGRRRSIDALMPKEDVRAMLKELSGNAAVWYAADQSYLGKGAALIPFFGEPAMTNTAISRIAKSSGAVVLPFLCRRLPGNRAYSMKIAAPLDGFPSNDAIEDTRRLNKIIEDYIRLCPEQYWWIHQRFKGRPAEYPDIYKPQSAGQ